MTKVLCGGCFNKVHKGHKYFLKKCKSFGNKLVVVIANDTHNKKPYAVNQNKRKKNIEKLKIADKVIIGHPKNMKKTVEKEKPDIICLGYDQNFSFLDDLDVKVKRIGKHKDYTSSG